MDLARRVGFTGAHQTGVVMAYDESTAERIRRALAGRRGVVEQKMIGGLSFMVSGSMACRLSRHGFFLVRVTPETREQTLGMPFAKPTEFAGRRMDGFVLVEPEGFETDSALHAWVQRGVDNALALAKGDGQKTRPTKKRAKKARVRSTARKRSTTGKTRRAANKRTGRTRR